jgi:hypothetical protein
LKNSAESRRVAIVIAQELTEALATPHQTAMTPQAWLGCDELVGEALMIALGMIVGQVGLNLAKPKNSARLTLRDDSNGAPG